ncbi:hypothetical protein QEN19_000917 [Hanseniaspora menglaensis]
MNSFDKSNLQQTDMQSLQSRVFSLQKLSNIYAEKKEYAEILRLYEQFLTFKTPSMPNFPQFFKKVKKVNRSLNSSFSQESPIITLGTMLRIMSVDEKIDKIISLYGAENVQVLSFGSGSDLRFQLDKYASCSNIIELDFKETIQYKAMVSLPKENLTYIPCDLTNLKEVIAALNPLLKENVHTIVLMECLLCYLPIEIAEAYFDYFNTTVSKNNFELLHYVIYDPVSLCEEDSFTKIMYENLHKFNNLHLYSLKEFNSITDYLSRFKNSNLKFEYKSLWDYLSNSKDKKTLFKACLIDEFEELELLLSHYIILNS